MDPTPEQLAGWHEWVASRPPAVRAVAERFDPWSLYRLKPKGHRVTLVSFGEAPDGTVTLTVNVSAEFNLVMFERQVFGVKPDDVEPCEVPTADEVTGALFTPEQATDHIDAIRVMVRPDLWTLDPTTGKAVRKP